MPPNTPPSRRPARRKLESAVRATSGAPRAATLADARHSLATRSDAATVTNAGALLPSMVSTGALSPPSGLSSSAPESLSLGTGTAEALGAALPSLARTP